MKPPTPRPPTYPIRLDLFGSKHAELEIGSAEANTPRYVCDGEPVDIDARIPADLLDAGWHWHGTFLALSWSAEGSLWIHTGSFPFEKIYPMARWYMAYQAAQEARRAAEALLPVKKKRAKRPAPVVAGPAVIEQRAMFEEAA